MYKYLISYSARHEVIDSLSLQAVQKSFSKRNRNRNNWVDLRVTISLTLHYKALVQKKGASFIDLNNNVCLSSCTTEYYEQLLLGREPIHAMITWAAGKLNSRQQSAR